MINTKNTKIMSSLYNKVAAFLCSFPSDKYVHFIVCLIGTFLLAALIHFIGATVIVSTIISAVVFFLIGVAKELVDKYYRGEIFDKKDLLADLIGLIVGIVLYLI